MSYIAEKYGKTHSFVGNADTRILLNGTREDIEREVKRCMDIGKNCPGFIMAVGNHIPANTPVIGSKVLRMEALLPPIRNVPRWKRATAPAFTMQAKPTDRSHPDRDCGRASCFVRRQTRNRRTDAMADTQKLKPNTDPFSCL